MKVTKKYIVLGVMFLLGILMTYSFNIQQIKTPSFVDLSSENTLPTNCIYSDSEIYEEDQNCYQIELVSVNLNELPQRHFHIPCQLYFPFYTIWQPPRLS